MTANTQDYKRFLNFHPEPLKLSSACPPGRPLSARRSGQPACRGAALAVRSGSAPAAGDTSGDTWPVCVPTNGEPPNSGDFEAEGWRMAVVLKTTAFWD